MTPEELLGELKQANERYHNKLDAIMKSDDISVAVKAKAGAFANNIFNLMTEIQDYISRSL
jgi:hypothetical protein